MNKSAAEQWREDLASWAIPQEILDQAAEKPWIHPPALFQIPEIIKDSRINAHVRLCLKAEPFSILVAVEE